VAVVASKKVHETETPEVVVPDDGIVIAEGAGVTNTGASPVDHGLIDTAKAQEDFAIGVPDAADLGVVFGFQEALRAAE